MKAMARPPTQSHFAFIAKRLGMALMVFLCTALASSAWADPPGRVGRLGEMTGQVWLFSPDSGEWVSASHNRPLTTGDRVATDADARAEVNIGSSTVRLDSGSELEVLRIDDDHVALQLHNGSIIAHLRSAESANEFDLRTSEGRFVTLRPGRYRFDRADEASHVTVLSGEARFEGPGSALTVNAGQRAEFWLDRGAAQYSITEPVRDAFASWSADRDRRDERSASTRYISPEMTGAEDLDRYGRWEQTPDYGAVWIPRTLPVGWAPYSVGHWAWVSPWGWTWVDDQPWGFAPFHYGRWAMHRERWCWVPGTYVRRPVYAPALVAWVGGPHVNVSISVGNTAPAVGWFPLAPREVYVPTYRVTPHYVQQVNVTHVTNITNITTIVNNPQQAVSNIDYRNRHFPHAVTVVPQTVMVNRQPVAPASAQFRNSAPMQQVLAQASQKIVVSAPPVPTPPVDQVRRRHGFAPGAERATVAGTPGSPTSQNLTSTGVNIPAPPTRSASPGARPGVEADGRNREIMEQRRREMRENARPMPGTAGIPAPNQPPSQQAQIPSAPGARPQAGVPQAAPQAAVPPMVRMRDQAVERSGPATPAAPPKPPVAVAPVAPPQVVATPQAPAVPARTVPVPPHSPQALEGMRQEAERRQEAQRQEGARQQQEAQRQQEARRQQDVERQQEAQRQQEARRQHDVQRQLELQQRQQEGQAGRQRLNNVPPPPPPREAAVRPQAEPAPVHAAPPPRPVAAEPRPVPMPAPERQEIQERQKQDQAQPQPGRKPEARAPAQHDQQAAREEQRRGGGEERRRHGGDPRDN
jgi:hypothetical protein